jgi:spore maturation protein CgeB
MTRIFVAVRHSIDPTRYYGGLWSANFYPALRELGCEIVESQIDLLPTSRFMAIADDFTCEELEVRARTTERILEEVREARRRGPVHLFLSYFYNAHFDPAGFEELRRLGIPSVNFYCNSIYQFEQVAAIAARADFSWHAERDARPSYKEVGANPVWVQMGADPKIYYPIDGVGRQPKAVFVGQNYADRARLISTLIELGVPLDIFGPGWGHPIVSQNGKGLGVSEVYLGRRQFRPGSFPSHLKAVQDCFRAEPWTALSRIFKQWKYREESRRMLMHLGSSAKGPIPFTRIAQVFAAYDVCLNFSNVWADGRPGSPLIPHVRLRDFEGPMCRTCYLTAYTDEISEFYNLNVEIDTYRSEGELAEKTRFYLGHPDAADRLREAGWERAKRDHTWRRRFEQLFRLIGLSHSMN